MSVAVAANCFAMEKFKKILSHALLVFVWISIGFAIGKNSVKPEGALPELSTGRGSQVAVYYLHSTFRCVTCNTIESMTRELLEQRYNQQLADGEVLWIEADFQENEALARQFEVAASCVVVAAMFDGAVTEYQRLDEVWTFMKEPEAFELYIGDAIDAYLEEGSDS
jgi:hypothetical protein